MLQNKLSFNQPSVIFEITGLPDYSNNENRDQISIISQWKLMINDRPLIEGNAEHLSSIIDAFYNYSHLLINNEIAFYESKLINIKAENLFTHNLLLKSSKPGVKPLNIKIGNSSLSDIINCFDQFNSTNKVSKYKFNVSKSTSQKTYFNLINKEKLYNTFIPPFISICSLLLFSLAFIYLYKVDEKKEINSFNFSKIILIASQL